MPKQAKTNNAFKWLGATRITLGLIFLWAFFDKLVGLGFSTCRDKVSGAVTTMCDAAWLSGGSPTAGFLKFGTSGPLAEFYQSLAGNPFIDALFMIGLMAIGAALVLGAGVKIAAVSGAAMMIMMWSAALLPSNNPLLDDHIVYALVLIVIMLANKEQQLGFGKQWSKTSIVKRYPIFE